MEGMDGMEWKMKNGNGIVERRWKEALETRQNEVMNQRYLLGNDWFFVRYQTMVLPLDSRSSSSARCNELPHKPDEQRTNTLVNY